MNTLSNSLLLSRLRAIATPVIFAVFPVLALFGQNAAKLPMQVLIPPVAVVVVVAGGLLAILWIVLRDGTKASLVTSMLLIGFWVIWRPVFLLRSTYFDWIPESLAAVIFVTGIVAGCVVAYRRMTNPRKLISAALVSAIAILCWPIIQIAMNASMATGRNPPTLSAITLPEGMVKVTKKPTVVLMILDAYGRADQLEEIYGFDNSAFLDALRARGFIVAEKSTSNYQTTGLSLASFLNMDYLDAMGVDLNDTADLRRANAGTKVSRFFQSMGYTRFGFPTGYEMVDDESNSDHVLHPPTLWGVLSEFEAALVDASPIGAMTRLVGEYTTQDAWRANIVNTLENVHRPILEAEGDPVYVRAHVMCPHFPRVFLADGSFVQEDELFKLRDAEDIGEEYKRQVVAQTQGLNVHVLESIDRLLETGTDPPVILLVSDHGARADPKDPMRRQFENLCALYLPGRGGSVTKAEVDALSLVNLFRLFFNTYFDADLPLLETKHIEGHGPFTWSR